MTNPATSLIPSPGLPDPLLGRFRAALDLLYGERIERVVLFGSRARGDFLAESDYDVAVFLKSMPDRWVEVERLAHVSVEFTDTTGAIFSSKPFEAGAYRSRTPIMFGIRRDGRDF